MLVALLAGGLGAAAGAAWTVLDASPAAPADTVALADGAAIATEAIHPALQPPATTPSLVPEPEPAVQPAPDPTPPPAPEPAPQDATPAPDTSAEQEAARARYCTTPGWHCRTFTWQYDGGSFWLVLQLDPALHQQYRAEPKPVRLRDTGAGFLAEPAYDIYVSDPRDDAFMGRLATELRRIAATASIPDEEHPAFALAFVQHLAYTSDNVTTGFDEYPRSPFESLVDQGGDCEDTSILYASILAAWGLQPVLLSTNDHMGVGTPEGGAGSVSVAVSAGAAGAAVEWNGRRFHYTETTGDGWSIGERPPIVEGKAFRPWSLEPTPLFSLRDTRVTGQGTAISVETSVTNLGSVSGPAAVIAEATYANGTVAASNRCFAGDVVPRSLRPCPVTVDLSGIPRGASIRIEVKAWSSGLVHEVLRSSSFVPFP